MKVQWQLVDIESGSVLVKIGNPFDFSWEGFKAEIEKGYKVIVPRTDYYEIILSESGK